MGRIRAVVRLAGVIALTGLCTSASAQIPACRAEGAIHICQTEGFGTILNNDTAQARDEAIIDAQRRALEQVAGVRVEAETITRNQTLFDQLVRTETQGGVIQSYRALTEGATGDGRYRVAIEAWVKASDLQSRLESLVSELSIIVLIPETNLGRSQPQPVVENEIVARMTGADYRVLDHAHLQRLVAHNRLAALVRGDAAVAREIGLRFLSNLIVTGEATTRVSQRNDVAVSAYARVTARAIEAETGRIVATVSLNQVKGFARDDTSAGERALIEAAKPAADQLLDALAKHFKVKERRIEVRLRNLPSLAEYRRAKAFLEKQRWVSDVTEGGYTADESLLALKYPEKTLYLASRLAREPRYAVREATRSHILVEYRP